MQVALSTPECCPFNLIVTPVHVLEITFEQKTVKFMQILCRKKLKKWKKRNAISCNIKTDVERRIEAEYLQSFIKIFFRVKSWT